MPLFKRKSDKRNQQPAVQQKVVPPPAKSHPQRVGPVQDGTRPMEDRIGVDDVPDGPQMSGSSVTELQRTLSDEEGRLGDLGAGKLGERAQDHSSMFEDQSRVHRSRLCRTLPEFLNDNSALPYLIQYMDSVHAVQMVQCWLATESFNKASWSQSLTAPMEKDSKESIPDKSIDDGICVDGDRSMNGSLQDTSLTSGSNDLEPQTVPRIEINGKKMGSSERLNNNKDEETRISDSPEKVNKIKTHSRARSDSAAVDIAKIAERNSNTKGREIGHRRNTSDWKNVDPKTAVERDAINIYTKFLCKDATAPVGIPEEIRLSVIAKICPPDGGQLDPDCFKEAQEYVYARLEKQYFPDFLRSEFHCKYQVDILTSGRVYLADILYNESATSYFMEYLDQEGSVHMLHFWLAASNFQQQLLMQQGQYDAQQAQDDAMVLYDKYFSLQAEHPLGFDFAIRCEIESNICREGGPLPNCFATAMKQTFTTLESVHFPGFLSSQLYYKFLTELVNSIKNESKVPPAVDDESKPKELPKTQRNTLLAEGSVKKLMESDLSIDPIQLDPDSLWKRSDPGTMTSFGKVDSLGQFVPGFELDPESMQKRSGSKFSLKKLVNKEEDKAKEQMALQIAQMIINDVTVQTKTSSQPNQNNLPSS